MLVSEIMSRNVHLVEADSTVGAAALIMAEADTGIIPVLSRERLVGVLTDRDIVVRGVAMGKGPDCAVEEVMTREVRYCFENEQPEDVARRMADIQVRRFPVVDHDRILVGIVSLSDIAKACHCDVTGRAVTGITRPGGLHTQTPGGIAA